MVEWNFHPKPQTKPITIGDAFAGLEHSNGIPVSGELAKLICAMKPGEQASKYHVKGHYFGCHRLSFDKPAPTLTKSISNMLIYPNKNEGISIAEAKRIGGFPDNFIFMGSNSDKWARIGNSVPPPLARAIAENIRKAPFMKNVKQPTVISTFAGCGGSSLGYKMAGFKELLAVEWDDNAVETFKANFPEVPVYHGDIGKLTGDECMRLAGVKKGELDVFDGSPPCQGFSTAGKRKFDDPRNSLFKEYARLINELQPKVFVMENVTGMVKGHMKQAYLQIVKTLRECGYRVKGEVLNAMYYGVPQSRERVIVIGVRNDLMIEPTHPKPKTKPISVYEAWKELPKQSVPKLSKFLIDVVPKMKPGQCADDITGRGSFQTFRLFWNKPCPTITKIVAGIGFGALIHPSEDRVLSIDEMKLATSFPLKFFFGDDYKQSKARIGNSVPPNLMRAIAEHIQQNILAMV